MPREIIQVVERIQAEVIGSTPEQRDAYETGEFAFRRTWFVAVYLENQQYGGPEEGGWWYNAGELVRVMRMFRNERSADEYRQRLDDWLQRTLNKGRRSISSVMSDGRYAVDVFDRVPPRFTPEERPHYE